nr:hypothetical protein [Fodinicola feengrottensis]
MGCAYAAPTPLLPAGHLSRGRDRGADAGLVRRGRRPGLRGDGHRRVQDPPDPSGAGRPGGALHEPWPADRPADGWCRAVLDLAEGAAVERIIQANNGLVRRLYTSLLDGPDTIAYLEIGPR